MQLLAMWMSSLENFYSFTLPTFQSGFLVVMVVATGCMSSLKILNIYPLFDILFTNIFSHSIGCFFVNLLISEGKVLKSPVLMIDLSVSPFAFWVFNF